MTFSTKGPTTTPDEGGLCDLPIRARNGDVWKVGADDSGETVGGVKEERDVL